jgi:hypothetical protein
MLKKREKLNINQEWTNHQEKGRPIGPEGASRRALDP